MEEYVTFNIESGRPDVASAKLLLSHRIATARKTGVRVMKLIHGYGSTGRGGALRKELRGMLLDMPGMGMIRGEDFSIFDAATRALLQKHPDLRRDADLERANPGITLILLP